MLRSLQPFVEGSLALRLIAGAQIEESANYFHLGFVFRRLEPGLNPVNPLNPVCFV